MKRTVLVFGLLAVAVFGRVEAFQIGTQPLNINWAQAGLPYMSLYPETTSSPYQTNYGDYLHYDPVTGLMTIPGAANSQFSYTLPEPGGGNSFGSSVGTYGLLMGASSKGQSPGGLFALVGTAPGVGIDSPEILLSASIIGAAIVPLGTADHPLQQILMRVDSVASGFGDWGPYLLLQDGAFAGYFDPKTGNPLQSFNASDVFTTPWMSGPADYWDMWSLPSAPLAAAVDEPSTFAILLLGILGLAMVEYYRRAKRPQYRQALQSIP